MNKGEFVKAMAEEAGLSVKDTQAAYDAFVGTLANALKEGEKVSLVGFGTFEVKERAARVGINPKTKESIEIAASNAPTLKFGSAFKDLFN